MQAGILNAVELRVLRYVLAVVDAGSVVGAADQLQTSQPSLSRQIRRLEGDLGFALFRRGAGPLQLTAAGRRFVPLARDLLDRADAVERAARALARGRLRDVAIAATSTTHSDVIAPFLVTLGPEDPWPELRHESSDGVYRALERGADLAVGPHRPPSAWPICSSRTSPSSRMSGPTIRGPSGSRSRSASSPVSRFLSATPGFTLDAGSTPP